MTNNGQTSNTLLPLNCQTMNLRFLKYLLLSCLAFTLAACSNSAKADDDLTFNHRGEITGELTTVNALNEMHKSADKQRKKPCSEYDPHAWSSGNKRRLDANGNLVMEIVCKDDNRRYTISVNRADFVLTSCTRVCPTCKNMLECDAKRSSSDSAAQMRQSPTQSRSWQVGDQAYLWNYWNNVQKTNEFVVVEIDDVRGDRVKVIAKAACGDNGWAGKGCKTGWFPPSGADFLKVGDSKWAHVSDLLDSWENKVKRR